MCTDSPQSLQLSSSIHTSNIQLPTTTVSSTLSAVSRVMPLEQAKEFGVTRAGEYRKSYAESIKIVTDRHKHVRPSVPVGPAVTHQPQAASHPFLPPTTQGANYCLSPPLPTYSVNQRPQPTR